MPKKSKIDATDRKILRALQGNGRMSNLELSSAVNLSPSPCLRRLRSLEQNGVIKSYNIEIDAAAYGLPITVFVRISLEKHTKESVNQFEDRIRSIPEVLECFVMTGQSDYLLRVVVADLEDYERFVRQRLHPIGWISSIDTSFVYGEVKKTRVYPEIN